MDEQTVVTTNEEVNVEQTTPAQPEPKKDVKPVNTEIDKLKAALSKANGEAAEYKRQLREKQSEAERAEAERQEQERKMRDELATLRREKAVGDYTNKCMALEMDAELAAQTATALADGNMDGLFDCLKAFVEATTTRLNNEALNRQPTLSTGTTPSKGTVEDEEIAKLRRYAGLSPHR